MFYYLLHQLLWLLPSALLQALTEHRLHLQSLAWVNLLNSYCSVMLVGALFLASLFYVFVCVLVAVIKVGVSI